MQSDEREASRERGLVVKHQHSFSDSGRVPMWDSADPDRAPPPLPLNPGTGTNSPSTKPGASATVQAAAAALVEKSHDNTPSSYTTNPMPLKSSPEKSLVKGQHKRIQSLQNTTNTNRELTPYHDRRSPERPNRASMFDQENRRDKSPTRTGHNTPSPSGRDSAGLRPSSRYLSKPILNDTSPSPTMLALQNMQLPLDIESPTKPEPANSSPKHQQSIESLSAQILSLTNIATSLQHEMSQLSRRSKDNATDLVSLKAATNARDEDIRKSLKDLTANLTSKYLENDHHSTLRSSPYIHPGTGGFMLDNKPHDTSASPSSRKSYTLPRVPSPSSFALAMERDLTASPGAISTDGSASIALLEKVLREMATKEGQEKLLRLMEEVKSRPVDKGSDNSMTTKMLEEILNLMKENSGSRALVRSRYGGSGDGNDNRPPHLELDYQSPRSGTLARSVNPETPKEGPRGLEQNTGSPAQTPNILNDEVMSILKRVKNSVAEGGGLTNEVKSLVRELRGEVLGMGREIARKLDQADQHKEMDRGMPQGAGAEEIAEIVAQGLADLKQHMEHVIREKRRESSGSSISRATVDSQEVYAAVKAALAEIPLPQPPPPEFIGSGLEKDEILETVREAWETYKPEIELQNFGLERDEILECLTEGLKTYQSPREHVEPGATYEQVVEAIQQGLEHFKPPKIEPEATVTRDEIIATIRDCLESFEWPVPPAVLNRENTISREDVLGAVMEGLASQNNGPREIEFDRNDIIDAVRIGVEETAGTLNNSGGNEQIIDQFHNLVGEMKDEFKQYSAANGRDTEQVLDAVKDGLEVLRSEIESYVDRASDVTGKDEIIDTVKDGFRLLQTDLEKSIAESTRDIGGRSDTIELLDAMEKEFEHLRQTISNLLVRNGVSSDKEEIMDAIRDLAEGNQSKGGGESDVGKMVKEEFEHLRETLTMTIMRPNSSLEKEELIAALKESFEALHDDHMRKKDGNESVLSNTSELLDAFQDGIDVLRSDMDKILNKPAEHNSYDDLLDTVNHGLADVKLEIERLRESHKEAEETNTARGREVMLANESSLGQDIEGLKMLVTQLQIKIEAMETHQRSPEADPDAARKQDLVEMLDAIKEVQGMVVDVASREAPQAAEGAAKKEDTDAIETLLLNMKANIDEFVSSDASNSMSAERLEAIEAMGKETKDLLEGFAAHVETEGPTKTDLANIESIVKDIWVVVEDMKGNSEPAEEGPEKVVKEDVRALETILFEIKTSLEELPLPDVETMPTKDDIGALSMLVSEFKEKMEVENEMTAQAFEARKVEHGGLAEKIEEARTLISELKDEIKSKLGDSYESFTDLKTVLMALNDSAESFATADTVKELSDLVKREFERSHGDREAAKIETEEKDATMMAKHEEARAAIVVDLSTKIDEKFSEIIAKYEDAQLMIDSKFTAAEERDAQNLEALASTKAIAEDLKLVIGGMGDSVTQACDRMSDDAKTFFNRVDESFLKMDDMHSDVKSQHEHMREEFVKTLAATDRIESQMMESHPEILNSIKEILSVVGKHYEHSQKAAEELKSNVSAIPSAIPPLLPPPPAPPALPAMPREPAPEKYDDSQVHDKLNVLLNHATSATKSFAHIDRLEEIHKQVTNTAREVSEMVAMQSRLTLEDHENKKREAEETAVALEKRLAQKERVEAEVVQLNEEKDELLSAIKLLKQEKEELSKHNVKLSKEVSGLETALRIRREEMQLMEDRAESLERRIIEGALDHARSLLINRPASTQAMSLKRVPSTTSTVTRGSTASTVSTAKESSAVSSGIGMALKRRAPARSTAGSMVSSNAGKERRILSMSHVTGNRGTGERQMTSNASGGLTSLKRSQSVKSNYAMRKASWNSRLSLANKENESVREEEEEEDASGNESDTGTERRTSYTGTYTDTYADSMSYVTGSTLSTDRQSFGSSTDGLVAAEPGTWIEESEEEGSETETQHDDGDYESNNERSLVVHGLDGAGNQAIDENGVGPMMVYGQHSDSGLGTSASEKGFATGTESIG